MKNLLMTVLLLILEIGTIGVHGLTCDERISQFINLSIITDDPTTLAIQEDNYGSCTVTSWEKLYQIALKVAASFQQESILNADSEEVAKRFREFGYIEPGRIITYPAQNVSLISLQGMQSVPIDGGSTFLTVTGLTNNSRTGISLVNFDYKDGELKYETDCWAYAEDLGHPVELIQLKVSEVKFA